MIDTIRFSSGLSNFQEKSPFPYAIIDGVIDSQVFDTISSQLPSADWNSWESDTNPLSIGKLSCTKGIDFPQGISELSEYISSLKFLSLLQPLIGEKKLYADPHFQGAGIQALQKGGYLSPHADMDYHPNTHMLRTLTFIIFLNDSNGNGGELVLYKGSTEEVVIEPQKGRCVIFKHGDSHIHSVRPWSGNDLRITLAAFYYSVAEYQNRLIISPDWQMNTSDFKSSNIFWKVLSNLAFAISKGCAYMHASSKRLAYKFAEKSKAKFK